MTKEIQDFMDYLNEQVDIHDIYVLSGQGEFIVDILPDLTTKESVNRVDEILTLISQNLKKYDATGQFSMMTSRAFDCSGLGVYYFMKKGYMTYDTTADGLYTTFSVHISQSQLEPGDMTFQQGTRSDGTKYMHHVGYYIGNGKVIESKGRKWGVVKTDLATGGWTHFGRPKWWAGEGDKYLTRILKYVPDNMMRGSDVKMVQDRLNELKFSCGTADGIFGKNTQSAVIRFQESKKLTADGIVGKNTCEALGFKWAG